MLLRTVVAGYLGATLVVTGTGVSAYKLLRAQHDSVEALALVQSQAGPLAGGSGLPAEAPAPEARSSPITLPALLPPTSPHEERHAFATRPRLAHPRAPIGVSLREPSRRPVRTVAAAEQAARPHPHPALRPIGYPLYYRVYYPYAYYSYYPPYPRY